MHSQYHDYDFWGSCFYKSPSSIHLFFTHGGFLCDEVNIGPKLNRQGRLYSGYCNRKERLTEFKFAETKAGEFLRRREEKS